MSIISYICFIICFWILVSTVRKGADVLSPGRVFGFIWSLAIGLADMKLSKLQDVRSPESWIQLMIGPLSFLVGVFLVYVLNLNSRLHSVDHIREEWQVHPINHRRLYYSMVLLFILFLVGYGSIVLSGREIPILSSHPSAARMNFQLFGVGLFLHNVILIDVFTVLYAVTVQQSTYKKMVLICALSYQR